MRYIKPVFELLDIETDIFFKDVINHSGKSEHLSLDVYQPQVDQETSRPVILWIHGGGFRHGNDKRQKYIVEFATRFAKKGYVCIANDYRVRENPNEDSKGTLIDAISDCIQALEWIRNHSEQYRIDSSRMIIAGGSAGGMIAVNLCYGDGSTGVHVDLTGVKALVDLWGTPGDLALDIHPDRLPVIIVHGTNDQAVPIQNTELFIEQLKAKRMHHSFLRLEGAPHTPMQHVEQIDEEITNFLVNLL
ncbi:MAG: Carboxylesterase type [Bacilli bacterium]|nr:Carboxylesterase type [Bacilli bacterium]